MPKPIDLTGHSYGRVTVLSKATNRGIRTAWNCLCTCGTNFVVIGNNIKRGKTSSCGCLKMELVKAAKTTHGYSRSDKREYRIWQAMRTRCHNPNFWAYKWYGGRGIKVCERWNDFVVFLSDMGECPARYTLNRIDNDGNYEPSNCRWDSYKEQARNVKRNLATVDGKTMMIHEWAEFLGISISWIQKLKKQGMTMEQIVESRRKT